MGACAVPGDWERASHMEDNTVAVQKMSDRLV